MIDQGISVCYCPNRLKNGFRSRVAMRIDRPSCSCRQHSTRELSTFYNSLELPQCPTTRRSCNNRGISKKSLSTPDLLMSHQRPQRHQTCSDPDHVPADSHDPRCVSCVLCLHVHLRFESRESSIISPTDDGLWKCSRSNERMCVGVGRTIVIDDY